MRSSFPRSLRSPPRSRSFAPLASIFLGASFLALSACGGSPPPPVAAPVAKPVPVAVEPPPDVSPVPEPAGLVIVGRVSKADAILKTFATWTRLPLPGGVDLVRSLADDSVADSVDLSKPIDGAVAIGGSGRSPKPLIALSIAVKSFEDAKAKLGSKHRLTPGKNGQLQVEGIGRSGVETKGPKEEEDDDAETCVLSPGSAGARLVCGERDALDRLSPYLTRTVPLQKWTSDVHVEMTLATVREQLGQVRAALPFLARQMLGSTSPALSKLADAAVTEIVDLVDDTNRLTLDAQLGDNGAQATLKVDYTTAKSFMAKLATSNPQKADVPPPAFLHLPADTDVAFYGKGSDPKLFDHPRELLGNAALEATDAAGMPETERKAVRELIVDRMLSLFTGPLVYGKGYDAAAVDKAYAARTAAKSGDAAARDKAERELGEQVLGWHLVQVSEPITKVAPMLKDWAALWNRPAFAKWAKQQSSAKMLAQMRIVGMPAGVTLPKDAVHLEIVLPQSDLEEWPTPPPPRGGQTRPEGRPDAKGPAQPGSKPVAVAAGPPPVAKKIPRKAMVLHVIAVPDQGATWLGFGLDAKLLAQKAAVALSSAPDANTLGKSISAEAMHDVKANGAFLATVRGFLVFTALEHRSRTPFGMLGSLPAKGSTPIVLTWTAQAPSPAAAGGSGVAAVKLPRAAIEDIVKLVMTR